MDVSERRLLLNDKAWQTVPAVQDSPFLNIIITPTFSLASNIACMTSSIISLPSSSRTQRKSSSKQSTCFTTNPEANALWWQMLNITMQSFISDTYQKVLNQLRCKINTMFGIYYWVSRRYMMTSKQIQYGGRPPYWKSSFGYISTSDYPISAKFCRIKQNHVLTQVTWQKYQISKFEDGGRPPFWKWFYRYNSARNHPI